MKNPIDKDKVTEEPGTLTYPHHAGSALVKPEDVGKIHSRALSAMHEQTGRQLAQLQRQAALLAEEAGRLQRRVEISEKIYTAVISFEPFIGHTYHLYLKNNQYRLMMISDEEWGRKRPAELEYICAVTLLSDHTWQVREADGEHF